MKDWKTPVFFVLSVLLVCLASYFGGRVKGRKMGREQGFWDGYEAGWNAPHPADTVFVIDTVRIEKPVPVERVVVRSDTIAVVDTVAFADTLYVPVPIEQVMYEDSTYRAQVSGWHPSLDWIEVYQRTQVITERIPDKRRWTWGVSAGAGVFIGPDGKVRPGAGAIVGGQFRF